VIVGEAAVPVPGGGEHRLDDWDVLLTDCADPPAPWVQASLGDVARSVEAAPDAALALVHVLRAAEHLPVPIGLTVESMAYSMLQHGGAFQAWVAQRHARSSRPSEAEPIRLTRSGPVLDVVLQRPEVHNALSAAMRDALIDALAVVAADPDITEVHLRGDGPSFCSGGDLAEFGHAVDSAAAHRLRIDRSVGRRVYEQADRVTAHLHGTCVGAGIEIPAFAGRVLARPDTTIRLPEVGMGLIPGAGGTVSLPRRIGRHRTAFLALSGQALDAETARRWGLVDGLE
jgi:hypothetical protein